MGKCRKIESLQTARHRWIRCYDAEVSKPTQIGLSALLLIVAALPRLAGLGARGLWLDEAYSALLAQSFEEVLEERDGSVVTRDSAGVVAERSTRLVMISHVCNVTGAALPVAEIARAMG